MSPQPVVFVPHPQYIPSPDVFNGRGMLVWILVAVHVVALAYWIYVLATRGPKGKKHVRDPGEIKNYSAVYEWGGRVPRVPSLSKINQR